MPSWKTTCHEQLLPGASTAEKWLSAQAAGCDGVELGGRAGEGLAARLAELGPAVASGAALPVVSLDVPDHHPDPVAAVVDDLPAIAALGAGVVLVLAVDGLLRDRAPVDGLRELAGAAAGEGVLLCLRPVNRYEGSLLTTLDHAVALCRAVDHPAVRVAACTFHMNIEEADPPRALLEAGPWLGHVRLADSNGRLPGAGHLDWWATFAALDAAGYAGWVGVGGHPAGAAGGAGLPAALSLLRQAGG